MEVDTRETQVAIARMAEVAAPVFLRHGWKYKNGPTSHIPTAAELALNIARLLRVLGEKLEARRCGRIVVECDDDGFGKEFRVYLELGVFLDEEWHL